MSDDVIVNGKEITDCPDCEGELDIGDVEHFNDGLIVREIYCKGFPDEKDGCGFYGEEEFLIGRTFRKSEKPAEVE